MSVFRFKQFEVRNELSAMKVNTDGVLLGAAATLDAGDGRILDVGTGTGTIALMLAQRLSTQSDHFTITGIDIDEPSASEAAQNFAASPWSEKLSALHCHLLDFKPEAPFDLIISNPPYFEGDLKAPAERRNAARHGDSSLSYAQLISFASAFLSARGRLSIILPCSEEVRVLREAASAGLHPFRILRIKTSAAKPLTRSIVEFARERQPLKEEILIMKEQGSNTSQYNSLVSDFYILTN